MSICRTLAATLIVAILASTAFLVAAPGAPPASSDDAAKSAGLIVFSSNRSGPWHIWIVRPDGTGLKELTTGPDGQHDVDPCWSPDGKSILFSSTRGGTTGVWRMAADGAKPERICDGDQAEWSPDGKRIVFRRQEHIYVRDLASGQEKCVVPAAALAPGGGAAAKSAPVGAGKATAAETATAGSAKAASSASAPAGAAKSEAESAPAGAAKSAPAAGAAKSAAESPWPHCSGPAWSPDGKTIAFACRWDAVNALFLVPADGGRPTKLFDKDAACEPHWSPDSKAIVYEMETHIGTIGADGQRNRLITYFGGVQRYGRFSPDAKSIIFCQGATERGPWELYKIPAQGGSPVKVTEEGSDMTPDWKP